jgi:hypothetical protein
MTKQIKIEELIPFMNPGWVACNKNGFWYWYEKEPLLIEDGRTNQLKWSDYNIISCNLSNGFNIAPAKDWTKSLIKIERK